MPEDKAELDRLANTNNKALFNDTKHCRRWDGGIMGMKSQRVVMDSEKTLQIEQARKLGLHTACGCKEGSANGDGARAEDEEANARQVWS
mmetsp:Transcript_8521/g.20035  ORF Transcript_8521/g.20035 Transcript_8521/m.20035 type:complete len:90 (+) Transcript_8521:153-422(+)